MRCFWEITLPNIWPAMLGAFVISFILAFNNLEISFYNGVVFIVFAIMYLLMRYRIVSFGHRE